MTTPMNDKLRDLVRRLTKSCEWIMSIAGDDYNWERKKQEEARKAMFDAWKVLGGAASTLIQLDAYAYPDSGTVNGVDDPEDPTEENPAKMPFLFPSKQFKGEWRWTPTIDTATGKIQDWPENTEAKLYYKPCDDCKIILDGKGGRNMNDGEYVPRFLRPGDEDAGDDYLVMTIAKDGTILGWDRKAFEEWASEHVEIE